MQIPTEVQVIIEQLRKHGHEAYVVGGCVRDILREVSPKDWDIATDAKPEEIQTVFGKAGLKTFYENAFGTVTVLTKAKDETLKEVEITPFRIDEKYTDKRHPDKIRWAKNVKEDLARRDFTINAIAVEVKGKKTKIIDPFSGQKDIENKVVRAVGVAEKRFSEDALRMMRAVRFAMTLDPTKPWQIEEKTKEAIKKNAASLDLISKERIRDELIKIIMHPNGAGGIELLRRLGLLKYSIPELEQGFGLDQNKHHIYQIYQHNLLSLNYGCLNNYSMYVRLAALLHDIAKPKTKRGQGPNATFYGHEVVGAKMTQQILRRLKFPKKDIEKITKLTRYHLFYYNVDEVGESSVRRLLRKVGPEYIEQLLQLRYCDRIGSGVPKAEPYKLRHLKYLFDRVSQDPISTSMLKVSGDDVMGQLNIKPGPNVGHILSYLLSQVLSDPKNNTKEFLTQKIEELGKLQDAELEKLSQKAQKEIDQVVTKKDEMTKKKYWVT